MQSFVPASMAGNGKQNCNGIEVFDSHEGYEGDEEACKECNEGQEDIAFCF